MLYCEHLKFNRCGVMLFYDFTTEKNLCLYAFSFVKSVCLLRLNHGWQSVCWAEQNQMETSLAPTHPVQ